MANFLITNYRSLLCFIGVFSFFIPMPRIPKSIVKICYDFAVQYIEKDNPFVKERE